MGLDIGIKAFWDINNLFNNIMNILQGQIHPALTQPTTYTEQSKNIKMIAFPFLS